MTRRIRIGLAAAGRTRQIHAASLSGPVSCGPPRGFEERFADVCGSARGASAACVRDGRAVPVTRYDVNNMGQESR